MGEGRTTHKDAHGAHRQTALQECGGVDRRSSSIRSGDREAGCDGDQDEVHQVGGDVVFGIMMDRGWR